MESAAKTLDFDGDKKSAKVMINKANYVKKLLEDYNIEKENEKEKMMMTLDFTNPSNEMIDKFKGIIDLKDNRIQSMLIDIHKEYMKNKDSSIRLSENDNEKMMSTIVGNIYYNTITYAVLLL